MFGENKITYVIYFGTCFIQISMHVTYFIFQFISFLKHKLTIYNYS